MTYKIQTRNSISSKGLERLPASLFEILGDEAEAPDGILVRSANMLQEELPSSLLAIARAGAGTNNIPIDRCSAQGIAVFNTPGANANAVKELVLGALVLAGRDIAGALAWCAGLKDEGDAVPALVEKGKGRFAGEELYGKTIGVIGLGAIGVKVANTATLLGMEVLGYDPYISVDVAWSLSRHVKHCVNFGDLLQNSDFITLHLPVTKDTKGIIGASALQQMKPSARVLNFARGELVDTAAMLDALKNGRLARYITDFPTGELIGKPGVVCIPHLGASTPESEDNCAVMAAKQLKDYLLNGNIENSVNLPSLSMPRSGASRLCVLHRNVKGLLGALTGALGDAGINIDNLSNKSMGEYAYTMLDFSPTPEDTVVQRIAALEDVIRVRLV